MSLSLNPARASLRKGPYLVERSHGGVARKGRKQSAMCPAEPHRLLRRFAGQKAIEKSRRKPVAATHAIQHIQFARQAGIAVTVDPGQGAPLMTARRAHLPERSRHGMNLRIPVYYSVNHGEETRRV